jgi:hypothetical protein
MKGLLYKWLKEDTFWTVPFTLPEGRVGAMIRASTKDSYGSS